jgi:hypothetical protein
VRVEWLGRAHSKVVAPIVRGAPDDAQKPGPEARRVAALVQALETAHEGVLTCVLRVGPVSQAPQGEQVGGAKVPPQQRGSGGGIPLACPGDERGVGVRHPSPR